MEFAVDVTKDEGDGFLNFIEVGGREELVTREILH
jgi:hypothetical protein